MMAENVQGPMDVSLDSRYTGTFEVRAKASTVQVLQSPASDNPTSSSSRSGTDNDDDDDDGKHDLYFADVSQEWTRGWIGDDRKPEEFDRHSLGRIQLLNSLSPINLHLPQFQPPTAIRR